MFKSYLTIAFRSFWKNKFYSLLNIFGLASGIASCLLIFLFVSHELGYDKFFKDNDKIFRAITSAVMGEEKGRLAVSGSILGPISQRELPEVDMYCRYTDVGTFKPTIVKEGERVFMEKSFSYADSTFFQVFSFEMLQGDPATALDDRSSVVITKSMAQKYFPDGNPMGKTIRINNSTDLRVTGVVADPPANSHLQFGFVAPIARIIDEESWFPMNYITYLKLNSSDNAGLVSQKIQTIVERELGEQLKGSGMSIAFEMQPVTKIYMDNQIRADIGQRGNESNTFAFALIGIFILLVACVNYINLTTARSERRAREVGIRKVMGAVRTNLVFQFYGETFIITVLAVLLAVGITEFALPAFNQLIGQQITISYFNNPLWLVFLFGLAFFITLIAGSYPAMYLSGFVPVKVLRGTFNPGKAGDLFRKVLVVLQFSISIFLILGTLVIYRQLQYTNTKDLGFSAEQVLVVPLADRKMFEKYDAFRSELMQNANVEEVSRGSALMGNILATWTTHGDGMDPNKGVRTLGFSTDQHLLGALDIDLVAGDGFNNTSMLLNDSTRQPANPHVMVNEALIRALGWNNEEAVGRTLNYENQPLGKIVGVMKDFHFNSLRSKIDPIFFFVSPWQDRFVYIRVNNIHDPALAEHLSNTWQSFFAESPLEYSYLETDLQRLYDSEQRQASILVLFTCLSVVIGVLGLFGLTNYMIEKRTKEIGIRKTLGANIGELVRLLSWDFLKLVLIANLLAWPVAWYFMNGWLENFAYHISVSWVYFAVTGVTVMLVAFLTVAWHSINTARMNPVKSLRYE